MIKIRRSPYILYILPTIYYNTASHGGHKWWCFGIAWLHHYVGFDTRKPIATGTMPFEYDADWNYNVQDKERQ